MKTLTPDEVYKAVTDTVDRLGGKVLLYFHHPEKDDSVVLWKSDHEYASHRARAYGESADLFWGHYNPDYDKALEKFFKRCQGVARG